MIHRAGGNMVELLLAGTARKIRAGLMNRFICVS
jgi:hypothetical protein